jgi:cell division protease FtsH
MRRTTPSPSRLFAALELLHDHRPALDQLSERLLAEETVEGAVVYDIIRNEGSRVA